MASPTSPDASPAADVAPDASSNTDKPPSAARSSKSPPPESRESVWLRRLAIFSFWAVVLLLGLPIWLKTTAIYRADLPLQEMTEWAEGKQICTPVFPLRIAVEAPFSPADAHTFLRETQRILDELNEFPAHQPRLLLAEPAVIANASQQVVIDGSGISSTDEDITLRVRLVQVETGATPRALLQSFSPTLDVYYSADQSPTQISAVSSLSGFLAQEIHALFLEEQAQLAYGLSTVPGTDISKLPPLSHEQFAELRRQSTRALKYAPTYHLTFSLFTPTHIPSAWDVEEALNDYIKPLLESFSSISNFTVDTQVQMYATISPSVKSPEYDEELNAWTLRKEDLSGFINAAEWPLSPSIGEGPTVNFILYVPIHSQSPLLVKENGGNSWLVPQWGGVHILNLSGDSAPGSLPEDMLAPAMHTFSDQLISLLGLPQTPYSLPLRISTLERVRSASLIASTSSTLGALAQVYQKLPSIPVPDNVAQSVALTIMHLQQACDVLREGRFQQSLDHARIAQTEAEKAFFERSMVGQVYFPDEHKVAVYLPLLGPVAVPLIMAALKEFQTIMKRTLQRLVHNVDLCKESIHKLARVVLNDLGRSAAISTATMPLKVDTPLLSRPILYLSFLFVHQLTIMPLSAQGVQGVKDVLDGFAKDGSPGLVFTAIDKSGNVIVEHAAGTVGIDSSEPMDKDNTIFWIASCTKLVAAIAVLQLVEQGKIPLDDADFIKKIAPEIKEKKVYTDGVTPADQEKDVTMRMLLSHTAGFAYGFLDPRVPGTNPIEGMMGDKNDIIDARLVNQPGSMWEYGINIDWAGIILERVTGQMLGDYMAEHIFAPLGISSEGATMFPTKDQQKYLAHMHQRDPDGTLEEREHLYKAPLTFSTKEQQDKALQSGGAGLFAKPKEYVKILAPLLNDGKSPLTGKTILKKETVDLMWENQIPNQPDFARNGPPPANSLLVNQVPEFYPQEGNPPQGWGFGGFITIEPSASGRGANTLWWMGLPNSFWWVDREKGIAGFLGAQVLPNGDPKVIPAWFMCEKTIYDNLQ
ncbi:beta-lactamase/transpeptidase-like protein [Setomelanomma holmii]|uniref:Beta-lactamase/transpeptidase-like protein n=1 Tax=Setomelanomma holmii TaxID=210430 RepID=A0A9P4HB53_9PLEO|nr:beta-lactamase/transpeptidase-like protein [Setomelanomma holmii]